MTVITDDRRLCGAPPSPSAQILEIRRNPKDGFLGDDEVIPQITFPFMPVNEGPAPEAPSPS